MEVMRKLTIIDLVHRILIMWIISRRRRGLRKRERIIRIL
jgi:hypothetical protein